MKRLQWKDEDLEHERKSSQRMETELNRKVHTCIITVYNTLHTSARMNCN